MNPFKSKVGNKPLSASHLILWKRELNNLDDETIKTANLADYREKPMTPDMVLGCAFHEQMLQPREFKKNEKKWNMKLTARDKKRMFIMGQYWLKTPQLSTLIEKLAPRESKIIGVWKEPEILAEKEYQADYKCQDGSIIPLLSRYDLISPDNDVAMDLKTTGSLKSAEYVSNKFYYNLKVGFYALLYELKFKRKLKEFTLICQETTGNFETGFQYINNEPSEDNPQGKVLQTMIDYAKGQIELYKDWRKRIDKFKLKDETFKRVKITQFKQEE